MSKVNEKILFIDAAARADSRTRELAEYLLEKLSGEKKRLSLYDAKLSPLDEDRLNMRSSCCEKDDFDDEYFSLAKQLAEADEIVIAAPYWDLSFPSILKEYLETVCITGITFRYSPEGIPIGLCKAKKLYYVTTAGGCVLNDAFGFGYVQSLFRDMFGVKDFEYIKAEGLDIYGADVDQIMNNAKASIDKLCRAENNL